LGGGGGSAGGLDLCDPIARTRPTALRLGIVGTTALSIAPSDTQTQLTLTRAAGLVGFSEGLFTRFLEGSGLKVRVIERDRFEFDVLLNVLLHRVNIRVTGDIVVAIDGVY
jgi:hypothetical protein